MRHLHLKLEPRFGPIGSHSRTIFDAILFYLSFLHFCALLFDFYFLFLFVTFVFWFLPLALPFFWQVTEEMLHFRHKLSPYLGQVLKGRIEMTILRGTPVFSRAAGHLTPTPAGILLLNH